MIEALPQSDTWTTICCLCALEQLKTKSKNNAKTLPWLDRAIERGWEFMEKNKNNEKGIGFNSFTPNDADSSIWLCRAMTARANNCTAEERNKVKNQISQLLRYIKSHLSPCGKKIATYNKSDKILEFVNIQGTESAWLKGHDCVTANAEALAKELKVQNKITIDSRERSYLEDLRNDNNAYWWDNKLFCKIILNEINISSDNLPKRLTLRIPNHNDYNGNQTTYAKKNDTETSIALDNGCFEDCLRIIGLLQIE